MMIVLIVVLIVIIGALVAVLAGRIGVDSMSGPSSTSSFELPPGPLGAQGVDAVRFDQALRGYNMGQVDAVLDRLFEEIGELESQLGEKPDGARATTARPDAVADAEGASRSRPAGDEAAEIVQFRRRGRRSLGHEREDEASETAAREAVALDKGDEPVGSDAPGGRHAASRESSSDRHA